MKFFRGVLWAVCFLNGMAHADDFILSYWCGPPAGENLDQRYAEIAECNFNYAMMACGGGPKNREILDACQKNGLKYILYDARIMKFAPENPAFKTNLDAVISDYAKHPALGGYYIADEPRMSAFPQLGGINQYLLAKDPKRLPFINLLPNHAPEWALTAPYEKHVEKYLETVKPRLVCFDHYGLMVDDTVRLIYFENLEIIRRQSLKHDAPFGFIFQITPHGPYRDPSESDLRWQINSALAYGAKALLYFTYWTPLADPEFKKSNGIIDAKGNRSPHYEEVKRLNAAVKTWAPTLMVLKSANIFHTGTLPQGVRELPPEAAVTLKETGSFIAGEFKHSDGSEWWMIVNRDLKNDSTPTLHFAKEIKQVHELSAMDGKLSSLTLNQNNVTTQIASGAARLFKLSR